MLVLVVLFTTMILGVVGLAIDTGFHYVARRHLQNAADQATLAAAYEMQYGGNDEAATTAALDNAEANGFDNDGTSNTVAVNIPATTGQFAGEDGSIEVVIRDLAVQTFFIHVLVPSTTQIQGRGVSMFTGSAAGTGEATEPLPVVLPNLPCDDNQAVVDGRVTDEEDYTSIGQLISTTTSTHYGEAFYACDGQFMYFALVMNGPGTGGGVANENVYGDGGGCDETELDHDRKGDIDEIKASIATIGASSFTMEAQGLTITVDVDQSTQYRGDLDVFGDLAVGMAVEVEVKTDYGGQHVLAKKVKDSNDVYCPATVTDGYHEAYNTGWEKVHTYRKLEHSDRARFQVSCDGTPRHDFIQDYLVELGNNNWKSDASDNGEVIHAAPTASASSLEWNLKHPQETGWALGLLQSPPFNPQYPFYDSAYDGWIWEMLYEFKVPLGAYSSCSQVTFGLHDFSGSAGGLEGMHSSPAKTSDGVFLQIGQAFDVRLVE